MICTRTALVESVFKNNFQRLEFLYKKLFGETLFDIDGRIYSRDGWLLTPIIDDPRSVVMAVYVLKERGRK